MTKPASWKAWAESMEYSDKALLKFLNDVDLGKKDITDMGAVIESSGKSTSKFGNTLKSFGKSIGANLLNLGTDLAIGLAITGIVKAIDSAYESYDEALEKFQNSQSNYESASAEVENLKSQLSDIDSQIATINSQPLTITSQAELDNLQAQKAELEQMLTLQENIATAAKKQAAADAYNLSQKTSSLSTLYKTKNSSEAEGLLVDLMDWYGSDATSAVIARGIMGVASPAARIPGGLNQTAKAFNSFSDTDIIRHDTEELVTLKERREKILNSITSTSLDDIGEIDSADKLANGLENLFMSPNTKDALLKSVDNDIALIESEVAEKQALLSSQIEAMTDENGNAISPSYQSTVDELRDALNELEHYNTLGMSEAEKTVNSIDKYFGKSSASTLKNYFQELANAGELTEDIFKTLGLSAKDIGVENLQDVVRYFNDMATAATTAADAVESVDGSFEGVQAAFESENAGSQWDTMSEYLAQAKELYDQGLVGTDEFQSTAKFFAPGKINEDDYKYDSDAYVAAWQSAYETVSRWFDAENPLQSMWNFSTDLRDWGLAEINYNDDGSLAEIIPTFKTTAEAADALGVNVNAVDTALHKLEDYGFEFDDIMFSGDGLSEIESTLNNMKALYDSMDEGATKQKLGDTIAGWDEEYAKYQEDLSLLTEDQIVKIKFEYDLATIQQQIDELDLAWQSGDRSSETGASRIAEKMKYRETREEQTGYTEDSDDDYASTYDKISQLSAKFNDDLSDSQRESIQNQISSLLDLQNAFQDTFANGEVTNWDDFLGTEEFKTAASSIMEETGMTKEQLSELLGVDSETLDLQVSLSKEDLDAQLANLTEGETIHFSADVDGVATEINAIKDENGNITYTAIVDGVEQELAPVLNEDGTVNFVLGDSPSSVPNAEGKADYDMGEHPSSAPNIGGIANYSGIFPTSAPTLFGTIQYTIQTVGNTISNLFSGASGLSGTAHLSGTTGLHPIPKLSGRALAMGTLQDESILNPNWRTKRTEVALTGEEGQEMVVTRSNRWYTVGDNGAEFAKIPQGSIIFNAQQTKELLSKGKINSRGTAMISGTAYATGGRLPVPGTGGYSGSGNNDYSSTASAANNAANAAASAADSVSEAADEFEEKFDAIEILLDRMDRALQQLTDSIETYSYDLSKQSSVADQAMNQIRSNLSTLQSAYNRYIQEANAVGLDSYWQNLVKNGAIDITTITDESLKESIDEYRDWYEKALDVQDTIADMQQELLDLAVEKLENIEQYFENRTDYNDNFGYLTPLTTLQEAVDKLTKELDKQVSDGVIKEFSNEWYESMERINSAQEKLFEATLKKYQDIIDNLTRISDTLDNSIALKEARDEPILESDYQKQMDISNKSIQELYDKRQVLLKQQAIYDVGSVKYDEIADEIADIDDDIYGLLTDIEELKDKIWEVRWQPFFDGQEALSDLIDETDEFRNLLDSDAFVSETGGLTDSGLANIALISQSMNAAKQSIANYRKALENLQKDYDNGNISLEEYKENNKEFINNIAENVGVVESYRDEIVSLWEEMVKAENDVIQDSIDKHRELLQAKKDNDDYSRTVKNQVKDINALQAQISALESVNILPNVF
ncbi:hypothetical protein H8S37_04720 [Mediterraneibacter sp. NSJ-55]|uniref:Uncharacterized protein n=1 Tax=Mediterraneibacter hominis TaxID=2763054 RepID=A0A923RRB8_9FIRM|nr:hypothetical protein [Mediterraneibacter hominis]MBC5688232.1 hypothetical protein [Mediterraneibacter hominis]